MTELSQVEFDILHEKVVKLEKENADLLKENAALQSDVDGILEDDEYITPNYTYEGVGRIYIKCDNLADQFSLENSLDKIFKRINP